MITVSADNKDISVNMVEFSDGAITFKVDSLPSKPRYIWITVDAATPVYRVREEISLAVDAIIGVDNDFTNTEFNLSLEYTPYGRADRRFEEGNPAPLLDFFCFLRDELAVFDAIYLNDVHNIEAIPKGLNIIEKEQLECFKESLPRGWKSDYDVVVAPDLGATLKSKTIADHLNVECTYANKKRDASTGRLTTMNLPEYDFEGKVVLIPDDIADKAGTHMWLADLLKGAGAKRVDLYVTHAILPEGLQKLKESNIDKLRVYQTIGGYINKQNVSDFNK